MWGQGGREGRGERKREREGKGEGKTEKKKRERKRDYEELTQLWRLTSYKIYSVSQPVDPGEPMV